MSPREVLDRIIGAFMDGVYEAAMDLIIDHIDETFRVDYFLADLLDQTGLQVCFDCMTYETFKITIRAENGYENRVRIYAGVGKMYLDVFPVTHKVTTPLGEW